MNFRSLQDKWASTSREAPNDDFFADCALQKPAVARVSDPESSHEAARNITKSGKATSHRKLCLDFVRAHPGCTAGEIGKALGLDRYVVGKRLPELRPDLLINRGQRVCNAHGTKMQTWRPK